ncbi:hypothetical protein CDIK_4204, partial [Cucumispora dikerogammari]
LTQLNTKKMNELFKLHKHFFQHAEEEERKYKQIFSLPIELLEQEGIEFLADFMKDKMNIKIEFSGCDEFIIDTNNLCDIVDKNLGSVDLSRTYGPFSSF